MTATNENKYREALKEIANTKNLTATPAQFARHLQWMAADAIGIPRSAAPSQAAAMPSEQTCHAINPPDLPKFMPDFPFASNEALWDHAVLTGYRAALTSPPAVQTAVPTERDAEWLKKLAGHLQHAWDGAESGNMARVGYHCGNIKFMIQEALKEAN